MLREHIYSWKYEQISMKRDLQIKWFPKCYYWTLTEWSCYYGIIYACHRINPYLHVHFWPCGKKREKETLILELRSHPPSPKFTTAWHWPPYGLQNMAYGQIVHIVPSVTRTNEHTRPHGSRTRKPRTAKTSASNLSLCY